MAKLFLKLSSTTNTMALKWFKYNKNKYNSFTTYRQISTNRGGSRTKTLGDLNCLGTKNSSSLKKCKKFIINYLLKYYYYWFLFNLYILQNIDFFIVLFLKISWLGISIINIDDENPMDIWLWVGEVMTQ